MSETNVTNPSHVSILSGLRIIRHGVFSNAVAMRASVDTLPAALGRRGYQTAAFVAAPFLYSMPGWKGFDDFPATRQVQRAHVTTKPALEWLEQRERDRPFFLWAHYFDPHALYVPDPEDAALFYSGDPTQGDEAPIGLDAYFDGADPGVRTWLLESHGPIRDRAWPRAMYAAEVHAMDREIGRLIEGLNQHGLEPDTVVVLSGDHGESLGEHGIWYAHEGLFETQLRIPLVIHVPGVGARRSDAMASTLDIAPTLEELLGFELHGHSDGLSLVAELTGQGSPALRQGRSFVHQSASNHVVAVREGALPATPRLFDLSEDPGESRDLSESDPQRVDAMRAELAPWLRLGPIEKGKSAELSEEMIRELRQLGYADHIGG